MSQFIERPKLLKVQTAFKGFDGPFFPEGVEVLNGLYYLLDEAQKVLSRASLDLSAVRVHNRTKRRFDYTGFGCDLKTQDGYGWFCVVPFLTGSGGEIRVFFPYAHSKDNDGYSHPDRSVAIYTAGEVSQAEVNSLLSLLAAELTKS